MTEKQVVTPEEMNKQLGRMAYAALAALKLAQHDGMAGQSDQAENLFLVRWLKTALKQKRFHRCVAADLVWLSNLGQKRVMTAKLRQRLDYLWKSCCCDIPAQSALFRLTYATEMLKNTGWSGEVLSSDLWDKIRQKSPLPAQENPVFYISRDTLDEGFDDTGAQTGLLEFLVAGDPEQFEAVMKQHQLGGQFSGRNRSLFCIKPA
ncbi:DUF2913 family protein [Morganella morganii]|uniref:DUF2913 family protein n=1 Tax=Morganella morganii TaxID=582 RepID=UPI0034E378E8